MSSATQRSPTRNSGPGSSNSSSSGLPVSSNGFSDSSGAGSATTSNAWIERFSCSAGGMGLGAASATVLKRRQKRVKTARVANIVAMHSSVRDSRSSRARTASPLAERAWAATSMAQGSRRIFQAGCTSSNGMLASMVERRNARLMAGR
eukprot:scaffold12820_cov129-Isochrysis_galbana.AAC.3